MIGKKSVSLILFSLVLGLPMTIAQGIALNGLSSPDSIMISIWAIVIFILTSG